MTTPVKQDTLKALLKLGDSGGLSAAYIFLPETVDALLAAMERLGSSGAATEAGDNDTQFKVTG